MKKPLVLGNGQIEVHTDARADRLEVRFIVTRAPLPPTWRFHHLPIRPGDPVFDWAYREMVDQLINTVNAQLKVLPHYIGEQFDVDPNTGKWETFRNVDNLLRLLSDESNLEELLRAPDVQSGINWVPLSRDQKFQRSLLQALRKHIGPRPGAPLKEAHERKSVQIAEKVQEIEEQLIAPFEWLREYRRKNKDEPELDAVREQLTSLGLNRSWAKDLAYSRTPRMAACRVVSAELDPGLRTTAAKERALKRVKQADLRGRRHLKGDH
jgi:hypothetical protein